MMVSGVWLCRTACQLDCAREHAPSPSWKKHVEQRSCVFGFGVLAAEITETSFLGYLPHVQQVGTFLMMCFEGQIGWIYESHNLRWFWSPVNFWVLFRA